MKICNTGNHGSVSFKLDDIFGFLASHHNAAMPSSLCHFFTSNRHHNIIVQAIHFFGKDKGITLYDVLEVLDTSAGDCMDTVELSAVFQEKISH